ncbi:rubrerythrin-like domain-containing protein [Haloterrigena turkmenica]|nr:rubrerythrin-like domain-containing protein [Haloterrigena turkmenica]
MKDAPYTPDEESTYECFDCGTVVHATTGTTCPDCGSDMRNRGTPIE